MQKRIKQFGVLAIAALAVILAVPSAQAQSRGFHGGAPAHVAPRSNFGRGYDYGRGYGYGPGWGWRGPWIAPYPYYGYPNYVPPPVSNTIQVPVLEWNGYAYVTVYHAVTVFYDYATGQEYYVLDGRTYWLR